MVWNTYRYRVHRTWNVRLQKSPWNQEKLHSLRHSNKGDRCSKLPSIILALEHDNRGRLQCQKPAVELLNGQRKGPCHWNVNNAKHFVVLNNGKPTYQNTLGHLSYIDLTLVSNNLGTKCSWYTLNNMMGSDHMPIVCRVQDELNIESETITKWKLDKADGHNYREQCRKHLLGTEVYDENIENFRQNIIDMINSSASANIPQRKSGRKWKRKALPYWNVKIKSAIYERNRSRNKLTWSKQEAQIWMMSTERLFTSHRTAHNRIVRYMSSPRDSRTLYGWPNKNRTFFEIPCLCSHYKYNYAVFCWGI